MAYEEAYINRTDKAGSDRISKTNYNQEIDAAKSARNNQLKDTDPMVEKEGYLAVDNVEKMRRRNIR
jgi:hypothetical protein